MFNVPLRDMSVFILSLYQCGVHVYHTTIRCQRSYPSYRTLYLRLHFITVLEIEVGVWSGTVQVLVGAPSSLKFCVTSLFRFPDLSPWTVHPRILSVLRRVYIFFSASFLTTMSVSDSSTLLAVVDIDCSDMKFWNMSEFCIRKNCSVKTHSTAKVSFCDKFVESFVFIPRNISGTVSCEPKL